MLDDDVAAQLAALAALGAPALSELSAAEARRNYDAAPKPPPDPIARVEDHTVEGPGGPIPVRLYADSTEPGLGVVVFFHGGGWVLSGITGHDSICRRLALRTGMLVVSVDYRLAPEHPYPAALHDGYAGLCWVMAHAAELGIDRARIAIAGQSAGGALAAAVTLFSRDHDGPRPCFQLLEIPVMDDRLDTPSMRAFTDTPLWNRPNAEWGWRHYLGPLFGGDVPAYAAPLRAADLSGLPPAYISTMEFDPLRDEGEAYAGRLAEAGIAVQLRRYDGLIHGFARRFIQLDRARVALDEVAQSLREALFA